MTLNAGLLRQCACGLPARWLADKRYRIFRDEGGDFAMTLAGGNAVAKLRYCYGCGGSLPPLAATIDAKEIAEVQLVMAEVQTFPDLIAKLGVPGTEFNKRCQEPICGSDAQSD